MLGNQLAGHTRWMRAKLVPGAVLPDVTLPDHAGVARRLSDLAAGDPLVLVLYRGYWCAREQVFFRRLRELQDEIEVAFSRLVAISTDPAPVTAAFRAGLGARWPFLSDASRIYQAELDLRERSDSMYRPYPPTVFTLFPDLTIHTVYDGSSFWGRPSNDQIRADLLTITQRIQPVWDEGGQPL